ncbi:unnamed protein product [Pocillopora meandrina]|uniref:Alpha-type protein kinase domain-containing protein n=1 Tax=Pocillopora meandrina TaxID=46732 RepID=A0AAU9X205_9CNID|nr:unnamed protein product [Pocillopora meandrina]
MVSTFPPHQWSLMRFMKRHNAFYQISEKKLMLLDIQGSFFKLYDPEIATTDLLVNDASLDSNEVNFCAGNLSCIAIL